jgi:ABC-type proline/glycine betaine transport system ATPase subunit
MSDKVPRIEPIKLREYETKQSKYEMVPELPMWSIVLGPSGSGKTILLAKFDIRYLYGIVLGRIYIFYLHHLLMWI